MEKKYIVRLTDEERETLRDVIKKFKGSSQKVRWAQILLNADANGSGLERQTHRRGLWLPHQDGREHS